MKFFVFGQNLKVSQRIIASGTARILTADFRFSPEWDGMRKYAHFEQGEKKYPVLIENDKITADKNLNLGQGVWEVWVHGNQFDDDANFQRITTVKAKISVDPSGLCGDPLPIEPPSFGEQLDERVSALEAGGGGGGSGTTDHSKLTNRNKPDQHPMEAITGLAELRDKINTFFNADDPTLDQLAELINAIKANQGTIEQLTNGKINTADIVNDLTTGGASKVLSAEMGVELKRLIDSIEPPDLASQVEAAQTAAREAGRSASNAAGSADTANAAAGRADSAAETARGHAQTASTQAGTAAQSATTATEQASAAAGSAQTATSEADRAKREADRAEQAGGKPAKLEPLTFTGGASAVYDGTKPVTVPVPTGGGVSPEDRKKWDAGSQELSVGDEPDTDSTKAHLADGGEVQIPETADDVKATVPAGLPPETPKTAQGVMDALAKKTGGSDISLGVTDAKVGQIVEIEEVDENGKPKKWKAVDKPSEGGKKPWTLIDDVTVPADVMTVKMTKCKNGEDFRFNEIRIYVEMLGASKALQRLDIDYVTPGTMTAVRMNDGRLQFPSIRKFTIDNYQEHLVSRPEPSLKNAVGGFDLLVDGPGNINASTVGVTTPTRSSELVSAVSEFTDGMQVTIYAAPAEGWRVRMEGRLV